VGGGERSTPYTVAGSSLALQLTADHSYGLPEGNWSATSLDTVNKWALYEAGDPPTLPMFQGPSRYQAHADPDKSADPSQGGNQTLAERTCGSVIGERYKGFGCLLSKTR
jgi:hypothetical protein